MNVIDLPVGQRDKMIYCVEIHTADRAGARVELHGRNYAPLRAAYTNRPPPPELRDRIAGARRDEPRPGLIRCWLYDDRGRPRRDYESAVNDLDDWIMAALIAPGICRRAV